MLTIIPHQPYPRCPLSAWRYALWSAAMLLTVSLWASPVPSTAYAVQPADDGQQWAVLIGVQDYHRATRLRYTVNDVKKLAQTLCERGGIPEENILQIVDTAPNARFQPLRTSLLAEVPRRLGQVGESDQVFVYFSGHGFRDDQGQLYLAPIDCDPTNPESTCVSIRWLREQIAGCPAVFKLLVIDACHAGSEKGPEDTPQVGAKDLGEFFRDLSGVVTLASSTSNEKSQIWEQKQQSLFSYWLNQGLKGHADTDGDSRITIDELYSFVHRHVTHSAQVLFPRAQTPVRIVRSGTAGVPTVLRLEPQSLSQVLADMSEQLAWALQERQLARVGVLEFTNDTRLGELLGADFGLLGRHCAATLERQLMEHAGDSYTVVNRRRLQSALRSDDFSIDDLGSPAELGRLASAVGGMPAVALGTLRNRTGRVIHLHCDLLRTDSVDLAGSAGGTALLNESEWAMVGRSVHVKPDDRRPALPGTPEASRPHADVVIQRMDQRAEGGHPLLDPEFPFRVKIMVQGKQRSPVFRENDCFVALKKGEEYEIWIENRSGRMVIMRLLVDGLNTLPQKEVVKGVATYRIGAPVSLNDARFWLLDPGRARLYAVRGFVTELGNYGKLRKFTVVDAERSLAARQRFTEQIGLITVAFYAPAGGSRAIGTAAGEERGERIEEVAGQTVGNLLGVVHIRYVEPSALDR
jgi:uncharacterized caspase-like protein